MKEKTETAFRFKERALDIQQRSNYLANSALKKISSIRGENLRFCCVKKYFLK